ncbi:MAG TPA: hypothetical protein VNI78_06600 [Vicinamibacterales bacterium]|nr:hypothetical protein [Vicinamibacterales bacterium]
MKWLVLAAALALAAETAAAQTPGPGRGRGAAAGPSKPVPRHPDGRVNLGPPPGEKGFWGGGGSIVATAGRGGRGGAASKNLTIDQIPFQPWARALYEVRLKVGDKDDPHARCMPPGGPRQFQTPNGFEFIEQPELKRMIIVFGGGPRSWRLIHMDGRKLPDPHDPDLPDTYFGYSVGRWEGDTLVVESTGYNEKFWMHRGGLPHTDALRLTERFTRVNYDTLLYEVTIDDPKAYTRPWSGSFTVPWTYSNWDGTPGGEIHEYFCQDNERDAAHLR